jgi:hypothetical protein
MMRFSLNEGCWKELDGVEKLMRQFGAFDACETKAKVRDTLTLLSKITLLLPCQ